MLKTLVVPIVETKSSGKIRDIKGCPLCEAGTMEGKMVNNTTPVWICNDCPAILFEYLDHGNTEDLDALLNHGQKQS